MVADFMERLEGNLATKKVNDNQVEAQANLHLMLREQKKKLMLDKHAELKKVDWEVMKFEREKAKQEKKEMEDLAEEEKRQHKEEATY